MLLAGIGLLAPFAAREANAACTLSAGLYTCTGDTTTQVSYIDSALNFLLDGRFINTATVSPYSVVLSVENGNLNLVTEAGSYVWGSPGAIRTFNYGYGDTVISAGGSANGVAGEGIYAFGGLNSRTIEVTLESSGTIVSSSNGVSVVDNGLGGATINIAGQIKSYSGDGVYGYVASNTPGGLTINQTGGVIQAGYAGIVASNSGVGATTVSTAGDIFGTADYGIYVLNDLNTTNLTVSQTAGSITATMFGILTENHGRGDTSISTAGNITGSNMYGIYARNLTTAANMSVIQTAGTISGPQGGIFAENDGSGDTKVTLAGNVAGSAASGLEVDNNVNAANLTVSQTAGTISGGLQGIFTYNQGSGSTSISTAGNVVGTSGDGINAYNDATTTSVAITQTAGTISGETRGIYAENNGSGATAISVAGNVTGTTGDGIYATNTNGQDLTITQTGGTISGQNGISAQLAGAGTTTIQIDSRVIGTADAGVGAIDKGGSLVMTVGSSGAVTGNTYGAYIRTASSTLNVYGSLGGNDGSVYYYNGNNTLNIYDSARFTGAADFNSGTGNTINFYTGSYTLDVSNFLGAGNTINALGTAKTVITSLDSANNGSISVVGVLPANVMPDTMQDYTNTVFGLLGDIRSHAALPSTPHIKPLGFVDAPDDSHFAAFEKAPSKSGAFWLDGFGGSGNSLANSTTDSFSSRWSGVIGGADFAREDWRAGLFGGGGRTFANMTSIANAFDARIAMVGAYAQHSVGGLDLEASLLSGYLGAQTTRAVNSGAMTATGTFSGWFGAAELGLSSHRVLGGNWSIDSSLKARYLATYFGGCSETGSGQNVTYGAHRTQNLEQRIEAKLNYRTETAEGMPVDIWFKGGAFAREAIGSRQYNASVLGTDLVVGSSASQTVYGGTVGIGIDVAVKKGASFFAGIETTFASNRSSSSAAHGGFKMSF